jgi:hypothetical protein
MLNKLTFIKNWSIFTIPIKTKNCSLTKIYYYETNGNRPFVRLRLISCFTRLHKRFFIFPSNI